MHSLNLIIRSYQINSKWRPLSRITGLQSSKGITLSKSKIRQKNGFRVKRIRGQSVSSVAQLRPTLYDPMDHSTPGFPVLHQLPEFAQTHVHQVGDAIHPSHPLSTPSPPSFDLSQHQDLFQWVNYSHQVANYWSFSFSISPSKEYSGLISFRIDWLNLLAVQGTLKSLLQHRSSKASILLCSAFFIVQLSYPYMTTGKTKALTRWTFVGKVMSLLFNMLSRLVITFLPITPFLCTCEETDYRPN